MEKTRKTGIIVICVTLALALLMVLGTGIAWAGFNRNVVAPSAAKAMDIVAVQAQNTQEAVDTQIQKADELADRRIEQYQRWLEIVLQKDKTEA